MTLGSRTRRINWGLAASTIVSMVGCHAMPLSKLAPLPNRPQSALASVGRAALLPATVAMDPPSEMSSIEPVGTAPASLTRAENPAGPPREKDKLVPTPLLDAALERAKGIEEKSAIDVAPQPTPPAPPIEPSTIQPPPIKAEPMPTIAPATPPQPAPVEPAPKEPEPARPEEVWREGVRKLGSLARAKLEQSEGSASPWGLRARVLSWLAEPDIDPELGHREGDGVRAVLRALDEPPGESPRRGDEVRSAVLVLEDKAPLEIVDLRLCARVEGFGDFEPFEPAVRQAGTKVVLYCEFDGLRFEQTSNGFRTKVASQLEILPEGGGSPIWTRPLKTAEETCRRRRRDYYIAYLLILPPELTPGNYRIRLTGKDLTSDRSASREVPFAIARD